MNLFFLVQHYYFPFGIIITTIFNTNFFFFWSYDDNDSLKCFLFKNIIFLKKKLKKHNSYRFPNTP
jgi:hypothetical protein